MRPLALLTVLALVSLPFVPSATAAPEPPAPCDDDPWVPGPVQVGLNRSCGLRVTVHLQECLWGGHYETYRVAHHEVRVYECDPRPDA